MQVEAVLVVQTILPLLALLVVQGAVVQVVKVV
jgi:hypothetical protein